MKDSWDSTDDDWRQGPCEPFPFELQNYDLPPNTFNLNGVLFSHTNAIRPGSRVSSERGNVAHDSMISFDCSQHIKANYHREGPSE